MAAKQAFSASELASELGSDGRSFRKFLRAEAAGKGEASPGKGGRYSFELTPAQLAAIGKRFAAWQAASKAASGERAASKAEAADASQASKAASRARAAKPKRNSSKGQAMRAPAETIIERSEAEGDELDELELDD